MTVLTCEKCDTKFEVPDKALAGGRKVRCTSCLYIWYQEDPNAPPPPDFEAELHAADEAAGAVPDAVRPAGAQEANVIITEDEDARKLSTRAALFVFASLALISCILLLAVEKKITAVWPQSANLYRAIGIEAAPPWEGLRVESGRAVFSDGHTAADEGLLIVEATVTNMTDAPKTLPPFRVELTDISSGDVLQSWEPAAEETVIEAGESKTVKWGFTDARHKMGRVRLFFRDFD